MSSSKRLGGEVLRAALITALLVDIYAAAVRPATSAEGLVFTRLVSPPLSALMDRPFEMAIGLPYALLARMVKRAAGVSELSIRLPAVMGGILFGVAVWRVGLPWGLALLPLVANPWNYLAFCTASGRGLALGFFALAISDIFGGRSRLLRAGIFTGTAIGCDPATALGAVVLGAAAAARQRAVWPAVDELLLPAILTGALWLSPVLLFPGHPRPAAGADWWTRALVLQIPGERLVTVAASKPIEPGVNFYARRLHLHWTAYASPEGPDRAADYYVLEDGDPGLVAKRGLTVIARAGSGILARK